MLRRTFHRLRSVSLRSARVCSRWPRPRPRPLVPYPPPRAPRWRKRPAKAAAVISTARAAIAPSRVLAARARSAVDRGGAASNAVNVLTIRVRIPLTRIGRVRAPHFVTGTPATCCPTAFIRHRAHGSRVAPSGAGSPEPELRRGRVKGQGSRRDQERRWRKRPDLLGPLHYGRGNRDRSPRKACASRPHAEPAGEGDLPEGVELPRRAMVRH